MSDERHERSASTALGFEITALEDLDPNDPAERGRLDRELLTAMYVLVKNGLLFDENNPTLLHSCERMAAVTNLIHQHSEGVAAIQFLSDGVYLNRQLVRLDSATYERGEYLFAVWRSFGVGEIAALDTTSADDWLELIGEFKRSMSAGGADELRDRLFPRIKLSPLDQVEHGNELETGARFRAVRAYAIATMVMQEIIDSLEQGKPPRVLELKRAMQELIMVAPSCVDLLMSLVHLKRHKGALANHLVNTATVVLCLAPRVGLARTSLTELALQACFHDIGRGGSPANATVEPATIDAAHAVESVCHLLHLSTTSSARTGRIIAANETRLWANGEPAPGYPYPPSSFARLIAIAHGYDLMTTPTKRRAALLPDEAMRVMMGEAGRRYDAAGVRLLIDTLGLFPVGSTVSLTSGELCIVVKAGDGDENWASPKVKIVRGQSGLAVTGGPILDLATEHDRRIVACLDPEHNGINPPAFLVS